MNGRAPLPVALLLRRARNAKSPAARHDAALRAWQVALRLCAAATPAPDLDAFARGSFAPAVRAALAGASRLDAPEVERLVVALRPETAATPARGVAPAELVDLLTDYGNRAEARTAPLDAMAVRLGEALDAAFAAGLFGPCRLVYRERVSDDTPDHRVFELTGCSPRMLAPGEAEGLGEFPPGEVHVDGNGPPRSLHPWLLYRCETLHEEAFLFDGFRPWPTYLNHISGELLRGRELERAFPGVEAALLALVPDPPAAQESAEDAPSPAERDGFEIVGELGSGGMGVVHLARQRSLGRLVALKTLPPSVALGPSSLRRFRMEVSALARCDHPNVVKILAAGEIDGAPYYAMEHIEGADLAQVASELPRASSLSDAVARACAADHARSPADRLPQSKAQQIAVAFRDAARGLHHLHEHGVVHRDVKPGNLMITAHDGRAVVMDLGLALLEDADATLTRERSRILGTLRYMAPEQLEGNPFRVDRRADVYSLGAVFYELFTGRPFLDGATEARLIEQVLREAPAPPRQAAPSLPRDLDTILRKATEKAPHLRYETADALARDLDGWLRGRPVAARSPTLRYVAGLAVRRHRRLAWTVAASLAVLVVVTVVLLRALALERERAMKRAEEAERERGRAEDLATFILFDLREGLESIDRIDLMRKVAHKAHRYYQSLTPDDRNPARDFGHARALESLAEVLEAQGALADALAASRQALSIHERLAELQPDDPEHRLDIAAAHNRIGDLLQLQGNLEGGTESLRDSLRLLESLAGETTAAGGTARRRLVILRVDMGEALLQQGDLPGARACFQEAVRGAEALLRDAPDDSDLRRDLLVAQTNLADALVAQGHGAEALELYRSALALAEARARAVPADADRQRDLFVGRIKIGDVLKNQGDLAGAEKQYREGAVVVKTLVEHDPENTHWQRDLLVVHQILGDLAFAGGDVATALREHRLAIEIAGTLTRHDPTNVLWQSDLATEYQRVGRLHIATGQPAAALEQYRLALAPQRGLVERDASNTQWRRGLAALHSNIGEALLISDRPREALESFREAAAMREKLVEEDPTNSQWRHDLALGLSAVGEARMELGEPDVALAAHRRSSEILRELTALDPGQSRWKRSLAVAEGRVGDALLALEQVQEAKEAHLAGLAILERLLQDDPGNLAWQRDVSVSLQALVSVHLEAGDYAAAIDHARRAVANHRALIARAPHFAPELAYFEGRLRAAELLGGAREPETAVDHLRLAQARQRRGEFERAAVHFARAIEVDPALRDNLESAVLYNAACAAAQVDGEAAAQWHARALEWLGADLAGRHAHVQALEQAAAAGDDGGARQAANAARDAFRGHVEWARSGDPDLARLREDPAFAALFERYPAGPSK